MKETPRE